MRIWRAVQGEGSELGVQPGPKALPPSASPHAGVKTG